MIHKAHKTHRVASASEIVHDHLKEAILNGSLAPGGPLKQEEVASRLGLSRAPVREALNQLEREGLVVLRPRRGFVVASLDLLEIEEIFQIRMLLEEHAARTATQRRTRADIAEVTRLLHSMDRVPNDSPSAIAEWAAINRQFHATIYKASGQQRLCQMTSNLRDIVEHYVRLDAATAMHVGVAQEEHRRIVEAFEAGDAETAARLSREHCQHTCQRLIAALRRRRIESLQAEDAAAPALVAAGAGE